MLRCLSLFLVLGLLVTGLSFLSAKGVDSLPVEQETVQASQRDGNVTRVLVLGIDRAASLADSIFILSVSNTAQASILQIPRDTYAAYTERDYRKINGAYTTLGLKGTKRLLSETLGVPIQYVVALDLDRVSALVDAVGGIDLDVPQAIEYYDPAQDLCIRIEAGQQHLNGERAEHFLRFRSGYATADLGRMDAQKLFLRAFTEKCQALTPRAMLGLIASLLPSAETDLPIGEAVRLARILPSIDATSLPMLTAPGAAVQGSSGAWYYSLNRAGMIRAVNAYMLPQNPVTQETFDPNGLFDRREMPEFHNIYTAPDP